MGHKGGHHHSSGGHHHSSAAHHHSSAVHHTAAHHHTATTHHFGIGHSHIGQPFGHTTHSTVHHFHHTSHHAHHGTSYGTGVGVVSFGLCCAKAAQQPVQVVNTVQPQQKIDVGPQVFVQSQMPVMGQTQMQIQAVM
ncbi:Hypothetical_protein [Hexamita inflata]|uniref:Hypothetical_protein n=1 Tax=Hexamita inflata TaxID=28002 RepID=A0AA86RMS6_9EUKA|nr:Hypothetical protein HINF_LOCUS65096 [Hexamita inflata]